jgi:hypothetical protein
MGFQRPLIQSKNFLDAGLSTNFYLLASSEPKIAIHIVAAKYPAGDGDAATTEIQLQTSEVLTNRPRSDRLRSPLKRCMPS